CTGWLTAQRRDGPAAVSCTAGTAALGIAGGRADEANREARATRTSTRTRAGRRPRFSPSSPSTGGPTRKATYPIVAAKETRAADCSASGASAPAAEIATGNPSEAPRPQTTTAPVAAPPWSMTTTPAMPTAPTRALVRSTAARPYRLTTRPPPKRPTVIAAANTAYTP